MKKGDKGVNGGKPKINKNLNMSTKPGPDVESSKGSGISDPLRNTSVVPELSSKDSNIANLTFPLLDASNCGRKSNTVLQ